ncbi:MAG: hypothetical protein LBR11_01465, partial [Deltaproteobacteria bacterium]|nr:hypothetical protein [Deltaproteobacteria bacterium]
QFAETGAIFLADDLYSKESIIKIILACPKFDYIFTCKEENHITLFSYRKKMKLPTECIVKKYPGWREEKWEYCWMNNVPVKLGEEAIRTNFIELNLSVVLVFNCQLIIIFVIKNNIK